MLGETVAMTELGKKRNKGVDIMAAAENRNDIVIRAGIIITVVVAIAVAILVILVHLLICLLSVLKELYPWSFLKSSSRRSVSFLSIIA